MIKPTTPKDNAARSRFEQQQLDTQIEQAMQQHVKQCAWIVWSADYTDVKCDEAKVQDARKVLENYQIAKRGDAGDPLNLALRAILEGERQPLRGGPPVLEPSVSEELSTLLNAMPPHEARSVVQVIKAATPVKISAGKTKPNAVPSSVRARSGRSRRTVRHPQSRARRR